MKLDYHFDVGLDPDFRIASDAAHFSTQHLLLQLKETKQNAEIPGELTALPAFARPIPSAAQAAAVFAARLLRDCYGKLNCCILPVEEGKEEAAGALLRAFKAYRKDIEVVGVVSGDIPGLCAAPAPQLALRFDRICSIAESELAEPSPLSADGISPGKISAAVCLAGVSAAAERADRHARYLFVLPDGAFA